MFGECSGKNMDTNKGCGHMLSEYNSLSLIYGNVFKFLYKVNNVPSRLKPAQSQQNNVRTTFTERCSNVILLTLRRFFTELYHSVFVSFLKYFFYFQCSLYDIRHLYFGV